MAPIPSLPVSVARPVSLDRMVIAVERVRDRLSRAAAALRVGGIPYAVVRGNAVAAWVARVDEAAVRNTQDVDILLRREDLERAKTAMAEAGFVYRRVQGIDMFLEGPEGKPRDAVHVVFAGEKVREEHLTTSPTMDAIDSSGDFHVIALEPLVRMKLTSFRDKDRVHLRDLIEVGLVDATWPDRFAPELGGRLQGLLDTPEG